MKNITDKKKILFIIGGPAPPGSCKADNKFYFLSKELSGFAIGSTWPEKEDSKSYIESIQDTFGDFEYQAFKYSTFPSIIRNIIHIYKLTTMSSKIIRTNKIDLIVCYGFLATGISASILSFIYKLPLVVQVPGLPHKALNYGKNKLKFLNKILLKISVNLTLLRTKALLLLFKGQMDEIADFKNKKVFIFGDFAPISMLKNKKIDENIISFIGYPWELKGVDILIEAFKLIQKKHPDTRLKIAGHCPDRSKYEEQIKGYEDKVEFFKGLERKECINFIESTRFFVLPSRTEGMGRVLLESMAAQKTVIASNVDGIPHYLEDNKTGLLFESENIVDLAEKLEVVISNPSLADQLALNARKNILAKHTEEHFAKNFSSMVNEILKDEL